MGTFSCCSNNQNVCDSHRLIDIDLQVTTTDKKVSKQYTFNKKNSLFFDKKNFINMKNRNLFDEYEICDKVGEGAFGCVYKTCHKKTNFIRAVKAIKKKHIDGNILNNEISVLKNLDHPNVIKLFECFYDQNYYYMIQEYCAGGDLYDYIKKQKSFSEKKAASIIYQLLSAINHLHSKKIVHRDLKPENIVFVQSEGNEIFIKLIDFGTSININNEPLTQELGTIYYIAPEVFNNNYNEKCDVWSCGIILYTMLCGHPPFRGNKEEEIKNKIIKGKIEFIGREWAKVSKNATDFVIELLNYNANKRINAEQALKNSWLNNLLKNKDAVDNLLDENVIMNLTKFQSSITLQKASLAFIANQVGQNEEVQKLKEEFDKIDHNKDGVLSKDELVNCKFHFYFENNFFNFNNLGLSKIYPKQEAIMKVDTVFSEVDFNNDGTINFSEFITVTLKKEKLLSEDMLKKAFEMFDLVIFFNNQDGNGFITIDELKEVISLDITSFQEWEEIVKEVDNDGDGKVNFYIIKKISFDEFKEMMIKAIKVNNQNVFFLQSHSIF